EDLFGRSRPAMACAATGYAPSVWNRKGLPAVSAAHTAREMPPGDEARPTGLRFVLLRVAR
ncbi:MAG: hypothetical protein V1774_02055, partial [Candidatus Eisenbacteria bacterium]